MRGRDDVSATNDAAESIDSSSSNKGHADIVRRGEVVVVVVVVFVGIFAFAEEKSDGAFRRANGSPFEVSHLLAINLHA